MTFFASPHVNHLPDEILGDIFVIGLCNVYPKSKQRYRSTISSVCRRWRLLALNEAKLWTEISLEVTGLGVSHVGSSAAVRSPLWDGMDNVDEALPLKSSDAAQLERAAVWLRRSKNAPLCLSMLFRATPARVQKYFRQLVTPHFHRCKSLELRLLEPDQTVINYTALWLPLPGTSHSCLDDVRIHMELGHRGYGNVIDLGPSLTLRRLYIEMDVFCGRFRSGFGVAGEVELCGLSLEAASDILGHCRDVKKITMRNPTRRLSPLPDSLSFPSLEALHFPSLPNFPIQNAPNLKSLSSDHFYSPGQWLHLDPATRDSVGRVLTGLEVLRARVNADSISLIEPFVCSEKLKMIRVPPVTWQAGEICLFIQFLRTTIDPSPRLSNHERRLHLPFPGLKLLVIHIKQKGLESWDRHPAWFEPLLRLVRARPNLTFVSDAPPFTAGTPPGLDPLARRIHFIPSRLKLENDELIRRFLH
ncbi:uncharacterized protein EI90DRAFT_3115701 [Cantharellus anzutake]|uniref:uncharacterized protein n=1 Tax=Cantharellus anzutake TaxID=1750568 RepID=UPI001903363A|nr:uncharacterized protein EI90DRAFT_3115701 [Cantharellus anzutake]KAF8343187.1 hypothetical protein EI90DRAFT_3115701 [Cantharellus anzutake]